MPVGSQWMISFHCWLTSWSMILCIKSIRNVHKWRWVDNKHNIDSRKKKQQIKAHVCLKQSEVLIMNMATTKNGSTHSTRFNAAQQLPRRSILKRVLDLQLLVKVNFSYLYYIVNENMKTEPKIYICIVQISS